MIHGELTSVPTSAQSDAGRPAGRIPSLDGLRAVLIFLVIGSHATRTTDFPEWAGSVAPYLFNGSLGVSIFFVISGFLITWLLLVERERTGGVSLSAFYRRRVLRIFPVMYLFLLTVLVGSRWIYRDFSTAEWISAATFTRNYYDGNWSLGHLWSISVEEQFYLLWPLTLTILRSRRDFIVAAVVVIAFAPLARVALYRSDWRWLGDYAFFTKADSLMFGCLLAALLRFPQGSLPLTSFLRKRALSIQLVSIAVIYVVWMISLYGMIGVITVPFGPTLQGAAIMCLVGSLIVSRRGIGFRLLNTRSVIWVGVLSYSLYIWQQVILYPGTYPDGDLWWRAFPQNLAIITLVACLSYYGIERPFLRMKARVAAPK